MRFMIIVKSNPQGGMPCTALPVAMASYHGQLAQAGVLLDALNLHPDGAGWHVRPGRGRRTLVEGPAQAAPGQAVIAGCALIEVRTRQEAVEWSHRFPWPDAVPFDGEIEVRQVHELDEPAPRTH